MQQEQKHQLQNFWKERFDFGDNELKAFMEVNRENFLPKELKDSAYEDTPLPLLRGKTISQPTTVMIMTAALELEKGHKVFEVGTGSGYQTAIIAKIVGNNGKVVSTEIIPELVHFSKSNIKKAGLKNVIIREEDGSKGIQEEAPYDRIIITAACKRFPSELLDQLKPGGIIMGPVGDKNEQEMVRARKTESGKYELEFFGQFVFTPMHGEYGFEI